MVMSYSDPGIIVLIWVVIGGSALCQFLVPIPIFAYLAFVFYKFEAKKLFFLYLAPIVFGVIYFIISFSQGIEDRKAIKKTSNEMTEIVKMFCNEQSRIEFSRFVIPIIRSQGSFAGLKSERIPIKSLTDFSSLVKDENLKIFVKKYPEFSNIKWSENLSYTENSIYRTWKSVDEGGELFLKGFCKANQ
jgi:hypothetical protein